jgi:hypothetical protein
MLEAKLEQLSQLKRQLHKQQKAMAELQSQRVSPSSTGFNTKHLTDALGDQNKATLPTSPPLLSSPTPPQMLNLASASLQALPRNLSEIQKRMERDSAEANERLMARLKQGSSALHAAREEELLSQVVVGGPGGGCKCRE